METPTRADLARLDRKRRKKASNKEWEHPHDPAARITKTKDGRTHLAHKVEHAADMQTGAILAVTVRGADQGDTTTIKDTMIETAREMETLAADPESKLQDDFLSEIVADKGYHSNDTVTAFREFGMRSDISEPDRGRRNWKDKAAEQKTVYANRKRIRGERGEQLLRQRSLMLERPFAHTLETGGMRRVHLRHRDNILKRILIQYAALNLSLIIRDKFGNGTPRGLQNQYVAAFFTLILLWSHYETLCSDRARSRNNFTAAPSPPTYVNPDSEHATFATGC